MPDRKITDHRRGQCRAAREETAAHADNGHKGFMPVVSLVSDNALIKSDCCLTAGCINCIYCSN